MKISAKIDYACRSILELALHWPNQTPIQVNKIAQRQGIPIKFLTQILISLKQLGLVRSTRGKNGGYLLTKPPAEIRLSDLMVRFTGENNGHLLRFNHAHGANMMSLIWQEVDAATARIMENVNFEDICNRTREKEKNFFYEI